MIAYKNKNIFNNYFDCIYVIAIPKRKQYITNVMKSLNLNVEYIDAILKEKINKKKLANKKLISNNCELNNGRIACHLSHMYTLKKFLKTKNNTALIFEDDIKPIKNKTEIYIYLKKIMKEVPKDWELINFGRCWDDCNTQKFVKKHIVKSKHALCRHCYAVNREGAKKILKYSLPMINKLPGDNMISKLISKNIINAYSTTPRLFLQNRVLLGTNLGNNDIQRECRKN